MADGMYAGEQGIEVVGSEEEAVGFAVDEVVDTFGFGAMDAREMVEGCREDRRDVAFAPEANGECWWIRQVSS